MNVYTVEHGWKSNNQTSNKTKKIKREREREEKPKKDNLHILQTITGYC